MLDFGLVKDLSTDAELTHAGALTGTPAFMSPESIKDPAAVGPASDLYAVGAVGYFLLTGVLVFEGKTIVEVCGHHLMTPPVPPSERLGRKLPAGLESLVMACLEKPPERRPESALVLRDRLAQLGDVGSWTDSDARAWWEANRDALKAVPRGSRSPGAATLEVDLGARS